MNNYYNEIDNMINEIKQGHKENINKIGYIINERYENNLLTLKEKTALDRKFSRFCMLYF